jgi:hypothetical protein
MVEGVAPTETGGLGTRAHGRPTARLLLLGTFHFADRGLDEHKPRHGFDALSEQRQAEIAEVVERLAGFAPTKVAVERTRDEQAAVDAAYRAYARGERALGPDEVEQVGFRLAARLGHARVHCVNAWDRYYEPPVDCEVVMRTQGREALEELFGGFVEEMTRGQETVLQEWSDYFAEQRRRGDELTARRTLREVLVEANREENLLRGHGAYLVGWFKLSRDGDYAGVDRISAWYNRNLRIFRNLQRITDGPRERIILLIGGGHVPILRHCAQASPEYELVEAAEYLDAAPA